MKDYQHKTVEVDLLRPNPWNSNIVSPENEVKLDAAISRLGMFKPIICREMGKGFEILGGQHRWESCKRLGYTEVPIVNLGKLSDNQAKEIGLADNGRWGEDDASLLSDLLNSMDIDPSELIEFLPLDIGQIDSMFKATEVDLDSLNIDDDGETLDLTKSDTVGATHQIMRFKVPIEDAERISATIEKIKTIQGFTKSDSLTNAGDALVWSFTQDEE